MKLIFLALSVLIFANFALSEPIDLARESLEKSRAEYANTLGEISKKRAEYISEIKALSSEISELESELKTLKASNLSSDELAGLVSKKAQDFELMRSRVNSNLGALSKSGDLGYSQDSFLVGFSELLKSAEGEVFSEKIFKKLLSEGDFNSFKENRSGVLNLQIDPTLGKLRSARQSGLIEEIKAGGIWMYPILAFGLIALVVAIAKSIVIFSAKRLPKFIEDKVDILAGSDDSAALKLANMAPRPYKNLLVSFVKNRKLEPALLEESAYEHMLSAGDNLYSGLGFLSVTAAVAPLLGLLGTVTGIIKTFSDLSIYGAGNPELMSGGISEALITTEYGLVVAIPAFIVNAVLSRRAKAILSDMEKISSSFLSKSKV